MSKWHNDNNKKGGCVCVCVTIWNGLIQFKTVYDPSHRLEALSYKLNHTDIAGWTTPTVQDMIMIFDHT